MGLAIRKAFLIKTLMILEGYLNALESKIGGLIGVDGDIYALRKDMYTHVKGNLFNDFFHPMDVIKKGYIAIVDNNIISEEQTSPTVLVNMEVL